LTWIKISDKNEIRSIEPPFIAHTGNDFAIVEKIEKDDIWFIEGNKRIKIPLDEFLKMWTGYTLIAEPDKTSKEPDYEIHSRKELFHNLRKIAILSILVFYLLLFLFPIRVIFIPAWYRYWQSTLLVLTLDIY
jgi:ABC-type bacteriocin/lantibiotic exporters, contain an N-terminal double-glycine peptidase domain